MYALSISKGPESHIQSTLVMAKSKGLSEILQYPYLDISDFRFAELRKKINRKTTFHKRICNLTPEVRDILKKKTTTLYPQYFVTYC